MPSKPRRPKCESCNSGHDVHLSARPGQIPGAAYAQRWLCASCEYVEQNPDAARIPAFSKPRVPQSETLFGSPAPPSSPPPLV